MQNAVFQLVDKLGNKITKNNSKHIYNTYYVPTCILGTHLYFIHTQRYEKYNEFMQFIISNTSRS